MNWNNKNKRKKSWELDRKLNLHRNRNIAHRQLLILRSSKPFRVFLILSNLKKIYLIYNCSFKMKNRNQWNWKKHRHLSRELKEAWTVTKLLIWRRSKEIKQDKSPTCNLNRKEKIIINNYLIELLMLRILWRIRTDLKIENLKPIILILRLRLHMMHLLNTIK